MIGNKTMSRRSSAWQCLLALLCGACPAAFSADHQLEFAARLRYADLQDAKDEGRAASALLRVSLNSQWRRQFSTFVEVDHVAAAFKDEHSDGVRLNGEPVIPDVPGTEVNQAFFRGQHRSWRATLGRQVMEWDDQRFIGSVGFWQNEQSFDALRIDHRWLSASNINYAYIANANRIFGDEAKPQLAPDDHVYGAEAGRRPVNLWGDHKHQTHALRLEFNEWDYISAVLFAYEIDNRDAPASSNSTLGSRFSYTIKPTIFQYSFTAVLAWQERGEVDMKPQPHYTFTSAAVAYQSMQLMLGVERLTADEGTAFVTPLGANHEFNGWADVFSAVPDQGLQDRHVQWLWRRAPWRLDLRHHWFRAEDGAAHFGREVDIDLIYELAKHHSLMLRFADFYAHRDADDYEDKRRIFFHYAYRL